MNCLTCARFPAHPRLQSRSAGTAAPTSAWTSSPRLRPFVDPAARPPLRTPYLGKAEKYRPGPPPAVELSRPAADTTKSPGGPQATPEAPRGRTFDERDPRPDNRGRRPHRYRGPAGRGRMPHRARSRAAPDPGWRRPAMVAELPQPERPDLAPLPRGPGCLCRCVRPRLVQLTHRTWAQRCATSEPMCRRRM